ncbi:hypothetical protein [Nocardiopsis changdeensis]|uniref:hypothetical protein n=1 Tax=Nocardiopsis changdeensis TaxID=2831969 RepID=UPI003F460603
MAPEKLDLIPWARALDVVGRDDWGPVLERLRHEFGDRYRIVRLTTLWMATDLDPDTDTEPTIVETRVEALVRKLLAPGPRFGKSFDRPWGPDRL